jgi:hypothetical protein
MATTTFGLLLARHRPSRIDLDQCFADFLRPAFDFVRALGRFLNNHSGNDGRTRHRGAAAAGRSLFDPYQINGNSFAP